MDDCRYRMDLQREFEREDKDHSGGIDAVEFQRVLRRLIKLDDRVFDAVWAAFDDDNSGTINYQEFLDELGDGDDATAAVGEITAQQQAARRTAADEARRRLREETLHMVRSKLRANSYSGHVYVWLPSCIGRGVV